MQSDEHSFVLRFNVRADLPDELLEDDEFDERAWVSEWERALKPALLRAVFEALRAAPGWASHVRSRGAASEDEVEIVVERTYRP
jgi:hypothetical protein